jgi:hypothetical protein
MWLFSCPEQFVFLLRIKLRALIRLGVSPPSFDSRARNGVLCGPLTTTEVWPGWGLNPGLPNEIQALYPLHTHRAHAHKELDVADAPKILSKSLFVPISTSPH